MTKEASAEATVRNIRRKTRRKYSAEEKILVSTLIRNSMYLTAFDIK